jgi:hypothetical protein
VKCAIPYISGFEPTSELKTSLASAKNRVSDADGIRVPQMSDVFDEAISRQSPPNDPACIAAVVSSDERFAYFATSARSRCGCCGSIRRSPAACRCH